MNLGDRSGSSAFWSFAREGYPHRVELASAWQTLGIEPTPDREAVRGAYVARLFERHPDLSPEADADRATARLLEAFRVVVAELDRAPRVQPEPAPATAGAVIQTLPTDDDSFIVGAPLPQTLGIVLDAANRLGEITYIEPGSGLVQAVVEFVDGPVCQLLLSLQPDPQSDRGTMVTCSADSLDSNPAPPIAAVCELVRQTIGLPPA